MVETVFWSRLCNRETGVLDWHDVVRGRLTLSECLEAALMLDWREYFQQAAKEQA